MERKTSKQHVSTTDRDVTAAADPKPPWTKPTIRIMRVAFTADGDSPAGRTGTEDPDPSLGEGNYVQS